jgi:hypothetical protein
MACWWARRDLNPQPRDYESPALTVELQALVEGFATEKNGLVDHRLLASAGTSALVPVLVPIAPFSFA